MKLQIDRARFAALSAKEQDEATELLAELEYRREHFPLEFYFPHPKQQAFHSFTKARIRHFWGGNQTGKSTACLVDDLIQALPKSEVPEHLLPYKRFDPPFLCRIFAPTDAQLETVIYEKLQEYLPLSELLGGTWGSAFDRELRILHFACGSRFFFGTYRQEVKALGGSTLDRVHYDEEPPEAHRNEGRMRVMRRGGDEIFGMTPVEGITWTNDAFWELLRDHQTQPQVYEAVIHDDELDIDVPMAAVTVDMDDNPYLSRENKAAALAGLSTEERQARKSGKFVALHGTIYGEFSKSLHVIPEITDVPRPSTVVVGIDPGIRYAAGILWAYLTPKDEMVVFSEGYFQGMTVAQVAKEIHKTNTYYNVSPAYYVIDPSSRNKEHITGRSVQMEYADHGIVAIAGQNDVRAGINRVKERLQATLEDGDDGFWITANCENLIREMVKYRWKKPSRIVESDPKEAPVKKADHCVPAGTSISTEAGERRIEDVAVGDRVWTRVGLCAVQRSWQTSPREELWEIALDDGRTLTATAGHPIFTSECGWQALDALRVGDHLLTWPINAAKAVPTDVKRSCGMGSSSSGIPMRPRGTRPPTSSQHQSNSIALCGSSTTGQFLTDSTSITSMATPGITTPRTLTLSTGAPTSATTGLLSDGLSNANVCARSFSPRPRLGIRVRQGATGTGPMRTLESLRMSASPKCAEPRIWPGVPRLSTARLVAAPRLVGTAAVYNLTVDRQPEFFANGILVHNCLDALRYVMQSRPYLPILEEESYETELQKAMRLSRERKPCRPSLAQVGT